MFSIHSDDIKTHDKLPAAFYEVLFNPKAGYALKQAEPLKMTEKAYGSHPEKIEKVMHHFRSVSRNAGVILSGNKGIGKSFFAKSLAIHAVEEGYPVLIVTDNTPALPWFINSVQQEVVILMDEFDKTFPKEGEAPTTQENMLSLLDGLSTGKKLFIVTCNELNKMSEFVVNRPGRFHYHFRFENPSRSEMELYLKDKVKEFLSNPADDPTMPEKEMQEIEGKRYPVSKGVISLQNDRGTSYQAYIAVQNELVKAVNELRDEFSMKEYGKKYAKLSEDQQKIVRKVIPQNISEAEPKDVTKK